MKAKIIIALVVLSLIATLCTLCACNKTSTAPQEETPNINIPISGNIEGIDIAVFPEVETSYKNLEIYCQEVSKRLQRDENFISEDEWEVISQNWDDDLYRHNRYFTSFNGLYESLSGYYFPVVFRDKEMLVLWYTSESGSLLFKKLHGYGDFGGNYGGQVHYDGEEEKVISSTVDYTLTYNQETGEVKYWSFGIAEHTFTGIPKNSLYVGYSEIEGHLFRYDTDVYQLNYKVSAAYTEEVYIACIAHDVEYVIDADYRAASDPWSQPLFLMKDGSIKVYVHWEGDISAPADDPCHLVAPYHEGGIGV